MGKFVYESPLSSGKTDWDFALVRRAFEMMGQLAPYPQSPPAGSGPTFSQYARLHLSGLSSQQGSGYAATSESSVNRHTCPLCRRTQ